MRKYFYLLVLLAIWCPGSVEAKSPDIEACEAALKNASPSKAIELLLAAEKKRLDAGTYNAELEWAQGRLFELFQKDPRRTSELHQVTVRMYDVLVKALGEEHSATVAVLPVLVAQLSTSSANAKRARELAEKYAAIAQKRTPPDLVMVSNSYQMLGSVCECEGNQEAAVDAYLKSLENWRSVRPDNPGWAAASMSRICACAVVLRRFDLGIKYGAEAVETFKSGGLTKQSTYWDTVVRYGLALTLSGQEREALPFFQSAYDYYLTLGSNLPPHLAVSAFNAASKLAAYASNVERRYDKAADYLINLEKFGVAYQGETHPECIQTAVYVAQACASCGRVKEAIAAYERVLARRIKVYGEGSQIVEQTRASLEGLKAEAGR